MLSKEIFNECVRVIGGKDEVIIRKFQDRETIYVYLEFFHLYLWEKKVFLLRDDPESPVGEREIRKDTRNIVRFSAFDLFWYLKNLPDIKFHNIDGIIRRQNSSKPGNVIIGCFECKFCGYKIPFASQEVNIINYPSKCPNNSCSGLNSVSQGEDRWRR